MSDVAFSAKKVRDKYRKQGIFHTKEKLALIVKEKLEALLKGKELKEVADLCCGNGNLLRVFDDSVAKFGCDMEQEFIDHAKENLKGEFICDSVFNTPFNRKFQCVVGNPPFGLRDEKIAKNKTQEYAELGIPPLANIMDSAFLMEHLIHCEDYAVVIMGGGFLYRDKKEKDFRKWLINTGWLVSIETIEGDFFDDTKVFVVILCFDKHKTSKEVLFISNGEQRVEHLADYEEIEKNGFNLSTNRYAYVEKEDNKSWSDKEFQESFSEINRATINSVELQFKINESMSDLVNEKGERFVDDASVELIRGLKALIKEWEQKLKINQKKSAIQRIGTQGSLF